MSINNFVGVGRLTADIELRYTGTGKAVGNFTLAMNRPFKNAQGENEADFVRHVVWGKTAENVSNHTKKGDRIGVTGRIQTGSYDDKDGKKVYTTEVVAENVQFLEGKPSNQSNNQSNQGGNQQPKQPDDPFQNDGKQIDISDDDLPF